MFVGHRYQHLVMLLPMHQCLPMPSSEQSTESFGHLEIKQIDSDISHPSNLETNLRLLTTVRAETAGGDAMHETCHPQTRKPNAMPEHVRIACPGALTTFESRCRCR